MDVVDDDDDNVVVVAAVVVVFIRVPPADVGVLGVGGLQ